MYYADQMFKYVFLNEKVWILFEISLKFIPKGPIDKRSVLVQVMGWHLIGGKQLTWSMLTKISDAIWLH